MDAREELKKVDAHLKAVRGRGFQVLDSMAIGDPLKWLLNRERERILAEIDAPSVVEHPNGRPKTINRMRIPTSEITN